MVEMDALINSVVMKYTSWTSLLLFVLFINTESAASQSIIKTLPGYDATLPFTLETGYIGVGEADKKQIFYYFFESERSPENDPLLLWLTGGPGCSGLCGLAFEVGPFAFDFSTFNGSGLPSLILRAHSWTKVANVIFGDLPVGTGFSYATASQDYFLSDTISVKDTEIFLRKWLLKHPRFIKNEVYIAGDSYAAKLIPVTVLEITKGNEANVKPQTSLQGYLIGNPITDKVQDINEQVPFFHHMALISDEYYESAKSSCKGEYYKRDPSNAQCLDALELINKCVSNIWGQHILEPYCGYPDSLHRHNGLISNHKISENDFPARFLFSSKRKKGLWCRDYRNYMASYIWANTPSVRDALHVRKGTIAEWKKCRMLRDYEYDVASAVPYHEALSKTRYKALVYSGDHDAIVPYLATLKWVKNLNLTVDDDWRPWMVNDQVAGYTQRFKKDAFDLTFATIKGAGHTAPEYKPVECLAMVDRWLSSSPL